METAWIGDRLALVAADIDFLDPALGGTPDARERGVRLELRPVVEQLSGSVYASPEVRLAPAVLRIDLLESGPGRADRMHWHPVMHAGEPGQRVFDPAIGADPVGWLRGRLAEVVELLRRAGVEDPEGYAADADRIASLADEVVASVEAGLTRVRRPWPDVRHDERGLAPVG
jgi:hypothetical protein